MADKRFNLVFDVNANLAPFKNAVSQIQGVFNKVDIPANFKKGIEDTLNKLTSEIINFESAANKGFSNIGDFNKANKSFGKIADLFERLKIQTKDIQGIDLRKLLPVETIKRTKELSEAWVKLKDQMEKGVNASTAEIRKQTQELEKQERAVKSLESTYEGLKAKGNALKTGKSDLEASLEAAEKRAAGLSSQMEKLGQEKGGKSKPEYLTLSNEYRSVQTEVRRLKSEIVEFDSAIKKNDASMAEYEVKIKTTRGAISDIEGTIKSLRDTAQQTPEGFDKLRQELADLKGVDISKIPTDINQIGEIIRTLNDEQLQKIKEGLLGTSEAAESANPHIEQLGKTMEETGEKTGQLAEHQKDLEQFANRIKYFFSIGNTVMLFRRAINSAIETVKELDEVMTQAAVVTKFTVADMWAQLPQYAQRANELGVTIKGVYEASTLYYQQGLETIEVIGVANETLKMAKIAGLDYATATDYMTSALRGFNMEVNELSAQRVNDIYSQLAAKTASNVEEIATAMSKTAPLAHNAGMEIETTAALLAQMIERTREAPETLGTAMKTVIARFQELKKDPALVEPVEGEIVDANKVETALRTIGVSLRDTSGQFRNLDEVFLEISKKWDSLSTNTQRYIATIAAGSRQQSRFIAMMADYKRTTDLVALANNAAGASAEQFAKTQDSLQSKLNRLNTAWEQFTMGLANNQIIKAVIDLITGFINIVNKLTNSLSLGSDFLKSFWDVGALILGISIGKKLFNGFFNWLLKDSVLRGAEAGKAYSTAFNSGISSGLTNITKKFSTYIKLLFSTNTLTRQSAALNLGMASATSTAASAQTGLNAALMACPLGWYVAAIAAVVAILALWFKREKEASLEGRMKAAAEETKAAKEAAEKAKNAYDDLLAERDEYNSLQEKLENVTYGTLEWKEALVEANNQVLKLIDLYPKLATALEKGKFGQFTISESGWENYIEEQNREVMGAQGVMLAKQLQESKLKVEKINQTRDETIKDLIGNKNNTVDYYEGILQKAIDRGVVKDFGNYIQQTLSSSYEGIESDSIWVPDQIEKAGQAILKHNEALKEEELQIQKTTEAIISTFLSPEITEELGASSSGIAAAIGESFEEKFKGINTDSLIPDETIFGKNNAIFLDFNSEIRNNIERIGKEFDENFKSTKIGPKRALIELYAKMKDVAFEDIEAMGLTRKELAEAIQREYSSKIIEKFQTNTKEFSEKFKNLDKEQQKYIELALTEGDSYKQDIDLTSSAKDIYDANKEVIHLIYDSYDDFAQAYLEGSKKGQERIAFAKTNLTSRNINIKDFGKDMDAGMIAGFSDRLLEIFKSSGLQAAQTFGTKVQNVFNKLNEVDTEKAKQFMTTLNGINWKNTDSVESLSDKLDELGITASDLGVTDIDDLEKEIVQLAKASREVDLEKLTSQIRSLGQIAYDIGTGKQGRNFSEEQMNQLVEQGIAKKSDFVFDFESGDFKYLGGSMEDLRQAILDNTSALNGEAQESLDKQIAQAQAASDYQRLGFDDKAILMSAANNKDFDISSDYAQDLIQKAENGDTEAQTELHNAAQEIRKMANDLPRLLDEELARQRDIAVNDYITQYQDNLQGLAEIALTGDEEAADALKTIADNAGVAEDAINNLTASELAEMTAVYQQAAAHDVDVKELQEYIDNLKIVNKNLKSNQAAQVALANTLLNRGLKKVIDSYNDWTKLIDETSGKIKRSTSEDAKVYEELKDGVADLLNISPELSEKLLDNANNIDLVRQAAEGSKEALAELQKIAAQEYLLTVESQVDTDDAKKAIEDFRNYLNSIELPPLEPGVDLSDVWAGTTGFIEACNKMIQASKLTGDQVTELFDGLGFTTELTTITRNIDLVKNYETKRGAQVQEDVLRDMGMTNISATYTLPTVRIKALKSNGSSGGGISNNISYAGGGSSGGGGGGSSEKEEEPWENPYDWLYNLTQKINAELRTREKLEKRYQRLLKTYSGTGEDLKKIADQELASLEKRKQYEQEMIKLRRQELKEYLAANAALAKYAQIDWELEVVRIDWNQINAVTDPEEGEAIEKYIGKLEELIQSIRDAEDAIDDIEDEIIDLKERGRDQYRDLEDRVLDALISQQQDIIDEQERIYDAINDAASNLIDAISKNIEKIRQDRQNEETETSLAEKERRLAYLRQDTTGSNALEIKKLEDELNKEKQNYTDALIDQSLNDLKEQNDYAAEQREKQIELMQSTLDWQQQIGYWANEATRIVREGIGEKGIMDPNSELYQLLYAQEGVDGMSNASKAWWKDQLKNTIGEAFLYLENVLKPAETGANSSGSDRDIMADIRAQAATGRANNSGMYELEKLENERNAKIDTLGLEDTWNKTRMVENYNKGYSDYNNATEGSVDWMAKINESIGNEAWDSAFYYAGKRDAKLKTVSENGAYSNYSSDFTFEIVLEKWYEATKSHTYKTGGLADFTGPAWLDGSKSKPEMVLNARDTENFLQLKDILSNLKMSFSGSKGALGGDWYFDIDINVGEIASDYDVDQLTERVKQSIYTESTYRNVNAINFLK